MSPTRRGCTSAPTRGPAACLLGALFAAAPDASCDSQIHVAASTRRWSGGFTVVAAAVAVVIGLSWFLVDGPSSPWLFRGGLFVHSLLAALLVAGCAARPDAGISRWFGWRPLAFIGVLSYSLYLWHWPIYDLLSPQRTGMSGLVADDPAARRRVRRRADLQATRRGPDAVQSEVGPRPRRRGDIGQRVSGCRRRSGCWSPIPPRRPPRSRSISSARPRRCRRPAPQRQPRQSHPPPSRRAPVRLRSLPQPRSRLPQPLQRCSLRRLGC